jgi:hypothetical protein
MYFFTKYTYAILDKYRNFEPLEQTTAIGFTGVAGERPPPVTTPDISEDSLLFGAQVNFNNPGVFVRIKSLSPQYEWMGDNQPTPINTPITAIAGTFDQALPVLPLIQPAFLSAQGKLQMSFTNAAANPITGGFITWRGLRLVGPIDGGWNFTTGFSGL